jgi:hypothetical protein
MKKSVSQLSVWSVLFTLIAQPALVSAHEQKELCNFMPKNNLRIPVGANLAGGIDEDTFNEVIDRISAVYEPIIKSKGGKLKVNRLWTDSTVNASAQRMGKTYVLNMYGGLARHAITTADGFALVVCHELGHHLGGFPQKSYSDSTVSWASNEGQSDYFATMKCFRRVFEKDDNAKVVAGLAVPGLVKTKCSQTFKSTAEINLCIRGSMGGSVLANLLNSLSSSSKVPGFSTPDLSEVEETDHTHPAAQCRLDTYFAGAVCNTHYSQDFGTDDASTGACAEEKGDQEFYRPHCWYKPQN